MRRPLAVLLAAGTAAAACGGAVDHLEDGGASTDDAGTAVSPSDAAHPDGGHRSDAGSTLDAAPIDAGVVDTGPPAGYPAPHPPAPEVFDFGGPVLASPLFIAVTFPGDALLASIESFVSTVGSTAYWTATTEEYGVGRAAAGAPVHLTEAAPMQIDDSAIQTWIGQKVAAGTLPRPDASTAYVIFYPSSTTITLFGSTSCTQFGAYHNDGVLADGTHFSYAVVPRCSDVNELTASTSHELVETATDPEPTANAAYGDVDVDHSIWSVLMGGGEVGDLCAQFQSSFVMPTGYGFLVQRCWSNAAAAAGHEPCVPSVAGEVYFNAVPVLTDAVSLSYQGLTSSTKGAKVPVGHSKTIEVDLYSDAPTSGPWTVQAVDAAELTGGGSTLSFSFDHDTGQNGDKLLLTITSTAPGTMGGGEGFALISSLGARQHTWLGFVGN